MYSAITLHDSILLGECELIYGIDTPFILIILMGTHLVVIDLQGRHFDMSVGKRAVLIKKSLSLI